jgi:thiamine transporter ThiT
LYEKKRRYISSILVSIFRGAMADSFFCKVFSGSCFYGESAMEEKPIVFVLAMNHILKFLLHMFDNSMSIVVSCCLTNDNLSYHNAGGHLVLAHEQRSYSCRGNCCL